MFECGLEGVTLKIVKEAQYINISNDRSTETASIKTKPNENLSTPEKSAQNTPRMSNSKFQAKGDGSGTPKMSEKEKKSDENILRQEDDNKDISTSAKDNGNVSSCNIEFKIVWFNFAAPPRAPITRKIDFTR